MGGANPPCIAAADAFMLSPSHSHRRTPSKPVPIVPPRWQRSLEYPHPGLNSWLVRAAVSVGCRDPPRHELVSGRRIPNLKQTARNSSDSVDFSVLIRARSSSTLCVSVRALRTAYVKVRSRECNHIAPLLRSLFLLMRCIASASVLRKTDAKCFSRRFCVGCKVTDCRK